jgi:hypothetical protein
VRVECANGKCSLVLLVSLLSSYVRFVAARAAGEVPTGAAWQRTFVTSHPAYKHDSVVSNPIVYDLMREISAIGAGEHMSPSLLGEQAAHLQQVSASVPVEAGVSLSSDAESADAGGAASTAAAPSAPLSRPEATTIVSARRAPALGVRLRGKSFAEEVKEGASSSALIKALIDRYTLKSGRSFADVPSFLSSVAADGAQ